ncbi:MAG: adenylate/guanylate cyclase domain-containing protein [Actinomycetota bacterium]
MLVDAKRLERFVARPAAAWSEGEDAQWKPVPGTLCFVDISGFTSLSERLAARGRVGAEELTEVLNRVFGSMLDLARVRKGELLKYGGDALLLLFEGEDHAVQAASAAVELRAALRKAVEIPTSVGRMALRMSVGIHTGEVHLFNVGGTHSELIVAGPAASMVTHMEEIASAGEIVISSTTRNLLPEGSATVPRGEGWLLRWRKPRLEPCGAAEVVTVEEGSIARSIPTALRSYLSTNRLDAEHKLAAIAFVEFVGVDDLLALEGADSVCAALGELIDTVTAAADDESVTFLATDVDENGGKIILVSGVPSTRIDESGRVLRVARRIADIQTPFGLKIGLNRGHVFAGEIGTDYRSTFTVMGDTVNLAARLMAAAPVGAIYATVNVVEGSQTVFEATPLDPMSVKGRVEPVRAAMVGDETGTRASDRSASLPFTGRREEFDVVVSRLQDVKKGRGGTVSITGSTGVGKTRLVDEALSHIGTDVYVVEVRAEPYGAASSYRPFRDEVRRILSVERGANDAMSDALLSTLRQVAPSFLPYAPLIGDVAQIDVPETPETRKIDPQFRRTRGVDTIVELLASWTDEPLVIVAEDLHWADPASLALLERLDREAEERSWLVISTSREELEDQRGAAVSLAPLDQSTTEELVYSATEAAPLLPDAVAAVIERSGGNPLFVQELLRIIGETGDIATLPTSLDGVVGSQIDALDPAARRALRYVSVLGRSFRTSIARGLLATQGVELTDSVRETLDGFLDDDGADRLRFRHALVRDVAYEGLPFRRRRDLHIRSGTLIHEGSQDDDAILDVLSLHFSLGGDRELAWEYSRRAGDRNMEVYANVEAETEFERAIDAARYLDGVDVSERRHVWVQLGDVRERSGKFAASLDAYRHATRLAGDDPVTRATVMLKSARAKERSGAYSSALGYATRARRLCEGSSAPGAAKVVAQVLGFTALIRQAQEKPGLAIEAAREAVEAAQSVGDDIVLAHAWKVMDYAYVMLGRLDLAVNSRESLTIFQEAGDLNEVAGVSTNLGAFAYWNGDWPEALDYYERGREASMQVGNTVDAAGAAANIGELLVNQGRYVEAEEPLRVARRAYLATGFIEGVGFVDLLIGRMYGVSGRLAESENALKDSIRELEGLGLAGSTLEAEIHLADARCRAGFSSEGLAILESAEAVAPRDHVDYYKPLLFRIRGSILASAGNVDDAIVSLRESITIADARGEDFEHSLSVLTLARITNDQIDPDAQQRAMEALHGLGVRSAPGISLSSQA